MDGFTPGYSANKGRTGRNMNMMMHPNQSECLPVLQHSVFVHFIIHVQVSVIQIFFDLPIKLVSKLSCEGELLPITGSLTQYDKVFELSFLCCAVFQKPYENRHRQPRQDSDEGSPKMEQRNNRPNNNQHHNQQNQQQQRGDGGESGGRGGGGGQYYNNNRNNNQQQNRDMGTNRELPPRFMKKLQQQQVGRVFRSVTHC